MSVIGGMKVSALTITKDLELRYNEWNFSQIVVVAMVMSDDQGNRHWWLRSGEQHQ